MKYRRLGETGLLVSELCLGGMTFGQEIDEPAARALIERFLAAGGNFLDTADAYSKGVSEEIMGRAIAGRRDEIVLATKVYFQMGDGPNSLGASRKHIIQACEASLQRLGTDYIDLYQIHCWDSATPLEETLSACSDLVRSGKVRYIGVSNYTGWQLIESRRVSERSDLAHIVSLQPQYSLIERNIEVDVLPACGHTRLGVLPWSPLGGGFLSGKYHMGQRPPVGSRIAGAQEDWEEAWHRRATERNWQVLAAVEAVAAETEKSPAQVALNWLLCQPLVTAPILGVRTMAQLEDNLGAIGWRLDTEQVQRLSEPGAPEVTYPQRFIQKAQR